MRAVVIVKPGGVEGLEIGDVALPPAPTADRVRVRVRAAALNRADILQRKGHYPAPPGAPQDIPGLEFAGEVDQIGPEVRSWQPGQRVFGICSGGAQAEYVVVPANQLASIPENLNWADAAAVRDDARKLSAWLISREPWTKRTFSRAEISAVRRTLLGYAAKDRGSDFMAAEQVVLGVESLSYALGDHDKHGSDIDALFNTVKASGSFDPAQFAGVARQVAGHF